MKDYGSEVTGVHVENIIKSVTEISNQSITIHGLDVLLFYTR